MAPSRLDNPEIELPGPWTHRYVSANGARFHLCESLPGSRRRLGTAGADAPRFPRVLVGLAPSAAGPGRRRLPRGRHGPAGLRCQRQAAARVRPDDARLRRGWRHPCARNAQGGARRARLGRVRRLGGSRPASGVRAGLVCGLGSTSVDADQRLALVDPRHRRCGTCLRCRFRGCRSGGSRVAATSLSTSPPGLRRRQRLPLDGRVRALSSGVRVVAVTALRTGVPPLAVPVPPAHRRTRLRQDTAAAGRRTGPAHRRRAGPGGAGRGGGCVGAARGRRVRASRLGAAPGISPTRRRRTSSRTCCFGWLSDRASTGGHGGR